MRWTKIILISLLSVFLGCELSDGVFENPLDREVAAQKGVNPPALVFYPDVVCLLYTSPSPRDQRGSRMPSSA